MSISKEQVIADNNKNVSSFRGWCMLTLNRRKSNFIFNSGGYLKHFSLFWLQ